MLLVLVDPEERLNCPALTPLRLLLLSVLVKEEAAAAEAVTPELWKVLRVMHPASSLGLFKGTLSSTVAAILSTFLKCLANLELKTGEGNLRLLFLRGCVLGGTMVLTERRVRIMEPFWDT